MTEKSLSFEVHPMRGHSRGEWYGTLEDVVENEGDADYWAVFGVTHRGNKHCLAEFPVALVGEGTPGTLTELGNKLLQTVWVRPSPHADRITRPKTMLH
jgi:hypothetical protein